MFKSIVNRILLFSRNPEDDSDFSKLLFKNNPGLYHKLLSECEPSPDCLSEDSVAQYIAGECSQAERRAIIDHAGDCFGCFALIDFMLRDDDGNIDPETLNRVSITRAICCG